MDLILAILLCLVGLVFGGAILGVIGSICYVISEIIWYIFGVYAIIVFIFCISDIFNLHSHKSEKRKNKYNKELSNTITTSLICLAVGFVIAFIIYTFIRPLFGFN